MQIGVGLTLRMDQNVLQKTTSGLTETLLFLQSRRPTRTGHTAILSLEMTAASIVSAAGGGRVLLRLKGTNGIEYNFALPVAIAADLQPQLQQAIVSAESDATSC